jgi:3-hydroxybutyryl-CoA dehydrogenase
MHFGRPADKKPLLELVRGFETSEATLAIAEEAGLRMGKQVVRIRESVGRITDRLRAVLSNEAFRMLGEGIASAADIDRAVQLGLEHPGGPLALADEAGLDCCLDQLDRLHQAFGENYRPAPLLHQYVKAGRLGRKSGRGVYDYGTPEHQAGKR